MLALLSEGRALALTDQAVVSAASFLTTVTIGRFTQPSELGLYAIGLSLLASFAAIQESLISTPYTIQRHRPSGTAAGVAGSSLAQTGLLSALVAIFLALSAGVLSARGAAPALVRLFWLLTLVAPLLILREFGRRFAFAHLRMAQALVLDAAMSAIQLAALGWLGWIGHMSAVSACAALGAAGGLTGITWLYIARAEFTIHADQFSAVTKQSWDVGKWLFGTQVIASVQGLLIYWLLAWLHGTSAAGIFTACMSIAFFANPLILGAGNLLTPKSALAWAEGGGERLRRESIRDALWLGAIVALFCAAAPLVGDGVMHFLYPGKDYAGQGQTVTVLAVAMLALAVGMPPPSALTSMRRPRVIFWTALWAAVVTIVLVWWLVLNWGLVGAAYGLLAGNVVRSAARWIAFLSLVSRTGREPNPRSTGTDPIHARLLAVLQQKTPGAKSEDYIIEQLGEGLQANIYAVRRSDHRQPIWQTYHDVVVKLYKSEDSEDSKLLHCQFEALSQLHISLNGRTINGWNIFTPAPLCICESPPALVMSIVPGKKLSYWLEHVEVPSELFRLLPDVVIATMNCFWSNGLLHGDLTFDNILCDIRARELSFVDGGMRDICPFGDDLSSRCDPPSHDLAHILYDTGVAVLSSIVGPVAFSHKQKFVRKLVQAFIETIEPPEARQSRLDEIRLCARLHLMVLGVSRSPRRLYQMLQRQIGLLRVEQLISRVRADAGLPSVPATDSDFRWRHRPIRELD